MIAQEVVRTCSNASVAQAALFSIGGEFTSNFRAEAERRRAPFGAYAADLVRDFAQTAGPADWRRADEAAHGADQPILSCLRFILDQRLQVTSATEP